ncbi:unnamed protein product [Ectocarpus sp. CCAP 1310/34]|nr:unnamed protein product [Ectocarpus sp. CCAP 1310/34]
MACGDQGENERGRDVAARTGRRATLPLLHIESGSPTVRPLPRPTAPLTKVFA